jgi:hypothetical protein
MADPAPPVAGDATGPATGAKLRAVTALWAAALALSAALAAAGRRWPDPLPIRADVVAALLLLPPLVVALALLGRWRLPAAVQGAESAPSSEDTQA